MFLDEEMCNYVDRKRWTREWPKRKEGKGAYYTIFKELAVQDAPGFAKFLIPGFADCFFNFVFRGRHLERVLLKAYGIANGAFYWFSLFCREVHTMRH